MLSHDLRNLAGWLLSERPAGPLPDVALVTLGEMLAEIAAEVEALERLPPPPADALEVRAAAVESGVLVMLSARRV